MSPVVGGILLFTIAFVLMFLGVHVAISLGLSGALFLYFFYGGLDGLTAIATKTYGLLDSFTLISVPLFLLLANSIVEQGISKDLFDAASRWIGFIRGGVAQATILACGVWAAMCGSSTAGVAAFGTTATPEMERLHYPRAIAFGTVAAGATLGILIPPSIPFIVYASITGESAGQLFMGGVIPGIIMMLLLMLHVGFESIRRPDMPKAPPATWKQRFLCLPAVLPPVALIVVVLGSIYTGIATPTEAAGLGATCTFVIGIALRRLNWTNFRRILMVTAQETGMILILVASAMVFGYVLTMLQMPQMVTDYMLSVGLGPWGTIVAINILLIILGCFMDAMSMMVILTPILYPVIIAFGFDGVWFGVIFVINMEIGLITPPFGLNLFVLCGLRPEVTIGELYRDIIPFCITLIIGLAIITAFPELSLLLPNMMRKPM